MLIRCDRTPNNSTNSSTAHIAAMPVNIATQPAETSVGKNNTGTAWHRWKKSTPAQPVRSGVPDLETIQSMVLAAGAAAASRTAHALCATAPDVPISARMHQIRPAPRSRADHMQSSLKPMIVNQPSTLQRLE